MPGQVIANGPISFSDANGRTFSIPLSLLYFDANGAIQADHWPLYNDHQALLDDWLPYLQDQGLIREGEAPAPLTAMVVKAITAGAAGNTILLKIEDVHLDPADNITRFDATVTETNTYTGLTPDTVQSVLGTPAEGGSKPGLVFVSSAGVPELPKAEEYTLADGAVGFPSTVDIPIPTDDTVIAFSLTARSAGVDGNLITVTIKDVNVTNTTFTLVAVWTKTVPNLGADDLAGEFEYEITVDPPVGALAPAAGTYALNGGADAQVAQSASVTLVANS